MYAGGEADCQPKTNLTSINEFYNGYDPMYTWWVPKTYQALDEALTAYAAGYSKTKLMLLPPQDKSGIVGQPVGREDWCNS